MRERTIALVVGGPGSGKSTLAKALLAGARRRKERVAIVDPARQFPGGVMPDDVDAWLSERKAARDVQLIVLDDADAYVPTTLKAGSALRDLALRNRWWGVDVIITARRVQSLPPLLMSAVHHLYVFRLSPADKAGRERLVQVAGDELDIPSEAHRFVYCDVFAGRKIAGKTLKSGGYQWQATP